MYERLQQHMMETVMAPAKVEQRQAEKADGAIGHIVQASSLHRFCPQRPTSSGQTAGMLVYAQGVTLLDTSEKRIYVYTYC
jgi:hypothetical protein